jgi:BTB/POZ domain
MFFWNSAAIQYQKKHNPNHGSSSPQRKKAKVVYANEMFDHRTNFDSDVDEPLTPKIVDWRAEAQRSFSDFTITIKSEMGSIEVYRVHRNIITVKSDWFATKVFAHGHETSSTICLYSRAAEMFPLFLDYMYNPETLQLNIDNATVFHFFGWAFQVRHLQWEAKKFWKANMSVETVATYYRDAVTLSDAKVLEAVKTSCCKPEIFLKFDTESEFLEDEDPQLLLHLVQEVGPTHSDHMSKLVAAFCSRHVVDKEIFLSLTKVDTLPTIAFSAVFELLEEEQRVMGQAPLTSLQTRCIRTLEMSWRQIDVTSNKICDFLSKQSPVFLSELLVHALGAAQEETSTQRANEEHQPKGSEKACRDSEFKHSGWEGKDCDQEQE